MTMAANNAQWQEVAPQGGGHRFIDLFCGIGGFRLALEKRGNDCVFSSDIDPHARASYARHFGDEPAGDITQIPAEDIPAHDILCAGFPCQPFSIANRAKANRMATDDRRDLFLEIVRVAEHHKPWLMLLENVAGLKQGRMKPYFAKVLGELDRIGYAVDVSDLVASDFGVPQKRRRLYFVCIRKDVARNGTMYVEPQPCHGSCSVADVLEKEVPEKYYLSERALAGLKRHKERHQAKGNGFGMQVLELNQPANSIVGGGMGRERNLIAPTLSSSRYYKDGSECLVKVGELDNGGQGNRVYSTEGVASTQSANGGGRGAKTGLYEVDGRIRRLTPRECWRLMGFPDHYEIPTSDTQAYRQAGNAVIPHMVGLVYDGVMHFHGVSG